ncbi:hypothetical protein MLD38_033617 [Melastoma candidum]|uniref:Uncharacterized protein n=1 Tax=Melastoma candidum TaxID=119954 RepID=A0ACB9MBP3_9MYRT|nr:hypothetical protein MLD38_033617 [Melastoma candidum]
MYSTRFWASQCKDLISSRVVTMARKETEKSWRKMVMAKRISMTSRKDCSLSLSTSASRREPRKMRLVSCHKTHMRTRPMLRRRTRLILEVDK